MQTPSHIRKPVRSGFLTFACVAIAAAASPARGADGAKPQATVNLKLLPKGGMEKLGSYSPQLLQLSETRPAGLKQAPPHLAAPLYGEIGFGGKTYLVICDEPKDGEAKLYVDSNGNGDLTDDPAPTWNKEPYDGPNGLKLARHMGKIQLPLAGGGGAKPELVSLGAYRFDPSDPQRAQLKQKLIYFSDYLYEGEVTLGGATYQAMLTDDEADGAFTRPAAATEDPKKADAANAGGGPHLLLDVNGDGKFSSRGETFETGKPFNIKGTTWVVSASDAGAPGAAAGAGAPVKIAASNEQVAEVPAPPNLSVGKTILAFTAERMDGHPVHFPEDYKGKVVMLDFWATWCPPCMAEVPGLVSAYNAQHANGLDVLGISLDQPDSADAVKAVNAAKGMTWPQVYEGKGWKCELVEKYGIEAIPATFLVDGDTGEILAKGESLRGENLAETLKKAMEKKGAHAAQVR